MDSRDSAVTYIASVRLSVCPNIVCMSVCMSGCISHIFIHFYVAVAKQTYITELILIMKLSSTYSTFRCFFCLFSTVIFRGVASILHCLDTEAECRRRENRGTEGAEGVGIREGCPPPEPTRRPGATRPMWGSMVAYFGLTLAGSKRHKENEFHATDLAVYAKRRLQFVAARL